MLKNNRSELEPVITAYKELKFERALDLLKKAKVKQEEAGISKQIKAEICLQVALNHCKQFKYKEAIAIAESALIMQAKEGFPLPVEKAKVICGISNLYLNNFTVASDFLKFSANKVQYFPFFFYYILSLLYSNQIPDEKTLNDILAKNKDASDSLPENRKTYFLVILNLIKENRKKAFDLLKKIIPESHTQTRNFDFLKSYLSSKKETLNSSGIKPLYKLLGKFELDSNEKFHLCQIESIKNFLENKDTSKNLSKHNESIKNLCQKGEIIPWTDFQEIILNERYKSIKNYLIINQISGNVGLHENTDPKKLKLLVENHRTSLVEFQEFGFLLLKIERSYECFEIGTFLSILNSWGQIHFNKMSIDFIELFSLELTKTIWDCEILSDLVDSPKQLMNSKVFNPELFGYQSFFLLREMFKETQFPASIWQKIILHPKFQNSYEILSSEIQNFLSQKFGVLDNVFFGIIQVGIEQTEIALRKLVPQIISTIMQPVELDSSKVGLLEFYKIVDMLIGMREMISLTIPKSTIDSFYQSLDEKIKFFKQDKPNAKFYDFYIQTINRKMTIELENIISNLDRNGLLTLTKKLDSEKSFETFLQTYIDTTYDLELDEKEEDKALILLVETLYHEFFHISKNTLENALFNSKFIDVTYQVFNALFPKKKNVSFDPIFTIWFSTEFIKKFGEQVFSYNISENKLSGYFQLCMKEFDKIDYPAHLKEDYLFVVDQILVKYKTYTKDFIFNLIHQAELKFPDIKLSENINELKILYPGLSSFNLDEIYTSCGNYINSEKLDIWLEFCYGSPASYSADKLAKVLLIPIKWSIDNRSDYKHDDAYMYFEKIIACNKKFEIKLSTQKILTKWLQPEKDPKYANFIFELSLLVYEKILYKFHNVEVLNFTGLLLQFALNNGLFKNHEKDSILKNLNEALKGSFRKKKNKQLFLLSQFVDAQFESAKEPNLIPF